MIYTQSDSKVGFWQGGGANFCVWSERPLCMHKARVKTENLLPSRRGQKPTFESLCVYIFWVCILLSPLLNAFDKVVIWGHKLHTHTHSYIHSGFYEGFKHLGYATYWFDDADDVSDFNFSNTLFLTEGQVDKKIPLRADCIYLLHNCTDPKYRILERKNTITF